MVRKLTTIIVLFCAAVIQAADRPVVAKAMPDRPNIIVIMTDDQRADFFGFTGNFPWLETPNLDRLADEGTYFENCFAPTSLCGPSRASFLTGLYPHNHGKIGNFLKGEAKGKMLSERLQEQGYTTAMIGKWHMGDARDASSNNRPGWDHWSSFAGQGKYLNCVMDVNGKEKKVSGHITDELNRQALDFVRKKYDKPYFLYLGHKAVHGPWNQIQERHQSLYNEADLGRLSNPDDAMDLKPNWLKKKNQKLYRNGEYIAPQKTWEAVRAFGELMAAIDEGVGAIISELEKQGTLDETVIIFASDNGFAFNDRGQFIGKRAAYEECIKIPVILRYPGRIPSGKRVKKLAMNVDMVPTICELANVPIDDDLDGISWLEMIDGSSSGHEAILYTYYQETAHNHVPTILAIRTPEWKFVTYPGLPDETPELYDLKNDPKELQNLVFNPEYKSRAKQLKGELVELVQSTGFTFQGPLVTKAK